MDRQELADWLDSEGFDKRAYSLRGGARDECLVLERSRGGWAVFYSERGLRSGEKWFATESDACEHMQRLLVRDPTTRRTYRDRTGLATSHSIPALAPHAETEISLANGDRIVLWRHKVGGPKADDNLVRLRADGSVAWVAEPPEASASDFWVAIEWVPDQGLVANSWSCWRVHIDPDTGKVIDKEFTK